MKQESNSQEKQLDQVLVESIAVIPRGIPEGYALPAPVWIGAGSIESDAHQANIVIQITPKKEGIAIEISLIGGRGHELGKAARLVIGGVPIRGGGDPVTVSTGADGRIEGILTSSDALETCVIHTATKECTVLFNWDMVEEKNDWTINPDYLPAPGKLTNVLTLGHHRNDAKKAPWKPLDQHDILFCVESVEYENEKGERKEELNTASNPKDLNHWAYFQQERVKTDADGKTSNMLVVQNRPNLLSVKLTAYDCSVWKAHTQSPAGSDALKAGGKAGSAVHVDERLSHPSVDPSGAAPDKDIDRGAGGAGTEDAGTERPMRQRQVITTEFAKRLEEFETTKKQLAEKVDEVNASQVRLQDLQQQVERLTGIGQQSEKMQGELERLSAEYTAKVENMAKEAAEKDLALSDEREQKDRAVAVLNELQVKVNEVTFQLAEKQAQISKMQEELGSLMKEQREHEENAKRLKEYESDIVRIEELTGQQEEYSRQMKDRLAGNSRTLELLRAKISDNVELLASFAGEAKSE